MTKESKMLRVRFALLISSAIGVLFAISPGAAPALDEVTAIHVLSRTTYGVRAGDVARLQQIGLERYIDEQLHPERLSDDEVERRLRGFETLKLSSRALASRYELPAIQARKNRQQQDGGTQAKAGKAANGTQPDTPGMPAQPDPVQQRAAQPLIELSEQKIVRAVYSSRQLEEVLTDFWFNHFNVDARKGPERFMLTEYEREVIRPHVFGRFRDLLEATAQSPAMLFYLDNWMSADPIGPHPDRGGQPAGARPTPRPFGAPLRPQTPAQPAGKRATGLNENYGRELLELHTLGVDGGYTQKDVTEVARAFTGWTIDAPRTGGGFRFASALHDEGGKVVLGHRIKAGGGQRDGEEVLDLLASHPSTARFISAKLARRFVSDDPPQALVDRMAATFRKTDGELRAVMTVLFTSPEFLSGDAVRAKVRNPFEFLISSLRVTNADVQDARPLVRALQQQLGMPLYQCQPPTGYKDTADAWVNTGALVTRMNVALMLSSGKLQGVSLPSAPTADDVIAGPISDATRSTIARAQTPPQALALALGSPEFQKR
jgi:uncharacterized protein (DUF1800 family)